MRDEDRLADLLLQWEEILEQGREVPAEELCNDCPHLIDELSRRIQAMRATSWMDKPVDGGSDEDGGGLPPGPPPLPLAGRYRLDRFIAEGGFGQVWEGFDLELERKIAVKLPKPSRLGAVEQFVAEARRVARLRHPGIVTVHDVVRQDDACFIVSDFVEGGSLRDRITDSPSSEQFARWIADVADALAYAHQQGFVHRDIKPANILIDHHGRALLGDFGIAARSEELTGLPSMSVGTLAYMSPEQLEGQVVDGRSDIYSLGVVLFELLTGRLPHGEEAGGRRHLALRGGSQAERAKLEGVCRRCLSGNPADRYQDAANLAADLRALASPQSRYWMAWVTVAASISLVVLVSLLQNSPLHVPENATVIVSSAPDTVRTRQVIEAVLKRGGAVRIASRPTQLTDLAELPSGPVQLLAVTLIGNEPIDALLKELRTVPGLVEINFLRVKMTGENVALLAAMSNLRLLRFQDTPLPVDSLRHIEKLPLEIFEVRQSGLTDDQLAPVARMKSIRWLNLSYNPITDEALSHLSELTRLEELRLNNTHVGDEGMAALTKLDRLRLLELRHTFVTDNAINDIAKLPHLRRLDVSHTPISSAALTGLQQALPNCEVRE